MTLYVKTLSNFATLPHETEHSNRYYIYSAVNRNLPPGCREVIRTDIEIRTPPNTIAFLATHLNNWYRSLDIAPCCIICTAKSEHIYVPLVNNSKQNIKIFIGLIIAELIVVRLGASGPAIEFKKPSEGEMSSFHRELQ